jgi:hypothetical protein
MSWLRLGATANLLLGLRPVWDPREGGGSPLIFPPAEALVTFAADVGGDEQGQTWTMPTVSVHGDPGSLAAAAFDHRVAGLAVGPLMAGAEAARFLGVDPDGGLAYLLVSVRRTGDECAHEAVTRPPRRSFDRGAHLTRAGQRAEARLRPGPRRGAPNAARLGAGDGQGYLDFFAEFGTHFVARVWHGDALLQAFAFERATLAAQMRASDWPAGEPVLDGERALACAQLVATGRPGPIVNLNANPEVADSLRAGEWHDEGMGRDCLLAPFAERGTRALALLPSAPGSEPVALELTTIARFLERYRGANWERLLTGALHQRFGDALDLPLAASSGAADTGEQMLLRGPPQCFDAGRELATYQERIRGRDLSGLPPRLQSTTVLCQTLELEEAERIRVPGGRVTLVARALSTRGSSTRGAPSIVVDDAAFDSFTLIADRIDGMVTVANASDTVRRTVIDGFVLETASDGLPRVASCAHAPAADDIARIAPLLAVSLRTAERLLCLTSADAERELAVALDQLAWIRGLPATHVVHARAGALHEQALRIATRIGAPGWQLYLSEVLEAAAAGDLERARRAHDGFWQTGGGDQLPAVAEPAPLAAAELHLLRAHALTLCHPAHAAPAAI